MLVAICSFVQFDALLYGMTVDSVCSKEKLVVDAFF